MKRFRQIVATVLILLASGLAYAHSMYQSALLLNFHSQTVDGELQLPVSRLGRALDRDLSLQNAAQLEPTLEGYVFQRFHAHSPSGQPWSVRFAQPLRWQTVDGAPYVVADFTMQPPGGASVRQFSIEDDVLTDRIANQVVLVSVQSDWSSSTFANDPELLGILNGEERSIAVDRSSGSWAHGFGSVFHLGVRHIAEGTDHLLFLLALLLPAPLLVRARRWAGFAGIRHGFGQILKVVTAFTLGHSVTLALAASGVVHVPSRPIETLIAVSILVSAVHAMRPIFPGKEAFVAGAFGLIHGLAFASTLAELGLHRWERVASIFAFNFGIEAMQLLVVLCIMPSLMLLSRTVLYTPFRILGALFASFAALGWIIERTSQQSLHVDSVVDGLAHHAVLLAAALFLVALGASYWRGNNDVNRTTRSM